MEFLIGLLVGFAVAALARRYAKDRCGDLRRRRPGRTQLMRLAAILLLLVAMTHYAYPVVATLYPDADRAARALFYVARGFEGVALFGLIGILVRQPLVWAMCLWGAVEEGQTAVCRLAAGIGQPVKTEPFEGLWPIRAVASSRWFAV